MDCRDRRYRKTYFAVDNRLYAFVQFDRPKIENHLLTPESMKKRKVKKTIVNGVEVYDGADVIGEKGCGTFAQPIERKNR